MKLIVGEKQIKAICEAKEEITYYSFFAQLRNFLINLLKDPVHAEASDKLQEYMGLGSKQIIERLIDADLLRRKSSIIETPKEVTDNGKSKVAFSITYSVPRKDFKAKVKKFYDKYVG